MLFSYVSDKIFLPTVIWGIARTGVLIARISVWVMKKCWMVDRYVRSYDIIAKNPVVGPTWNLVEWMCSIFFVSYMQHIFLQVPRHMPHIFRQILRCILWNIPTIVVRLLVWFKIPEIVRLLVWFKIPTLVRLLVSWSFKGCLLVAKAILFPRFPGNGMVPWLKTIVRLSPFDSNLAILTFS